MSTTVANTILEQLGGAPFAFMIGAKSFVGSADALTFQFMRNGSGANRCTITLKGDDTYTLRLWKVRGDSIKTVAQVEGLYFDNLRAIFSERTGLTLTMPRFVNVRSIA